MISQNKAKFVLLPLISIVAFLSFLFSFSQSTVDAGEKKICLNMIVKNESRIIERCMDSVKDNVDCISICDTGSTDNTVEVIESYLSKHHIPGEVHRHEWKNFGHNRTLSAEAAQQTLKNLGFPLDDTYLLLLDADMVLVVKPEFKKDSLNADFYTILQKNWVMSYYNTRLLRASIPWECVGATHEYWTSKSGTGKSEKLVSLWIDDREDGGCKTDKFERDVRLLTKGLEEEPDNIRYMFYLGQSYKCLKQWPEAIRWYTERVNKGGWFEEVWYAELMLGDIYEEMGDWDNALNWYLKAIERNPKRAEPHERLAIHYRKTSQHNLAYLFSTAGAKIPYPEKQILFITDAVYDYRFDEELSISAYYTSHRSEGAAAQERLLLNPKTPFWTRMTALNNQRFYTNNIKNIRYVENPEQVQVNSIRPAWFLLPDKDGLQVISGLDPLVVYEIEPGVGPCIPVRYKEQGKDLTTLNLETDPMPYEDGYLVLAYFTTTDDNPIDFHRFIYLNHDLKVTRLSSPFTFEHFGRERCYKMKLDPRSKEISMSLIIDESHHKTGKIGGAEMREFMQL